jgi:hypothetical protein
VKSNPYRRFLVRFLDSNPVTARIVPHSAQYPYGSAMHDVTRTGPCWLNRTWIEELVMAESASSVYSPTVYFSVLSSRVPFSMRPIGQNWLNA